MKKAAAFLVLALTGSLLYGCGGRTAGQDGFRPESSSIYVSRDGTVSSALVEAYEKDNYDEESLRSFLNSAVERYEKSHPGQGEKPAVALKECSVENGKLTAVFEYGSSDDLIAFGKEQQDDSMGLTSLEVKDAAEAVADGELTGELIDRKNQRVSLENIKKEKNAVAVLLQGEGLIQTEGKILYVSEGTQLDSSKNQAKVTGERSYIIFK